MDSKVETFNPTVSVYHPSQKRVDRIQQKRAPSYSWKAREYWKNNFQKLSSIRFFLYNDLRQGILTKVQKWLSWFLTQVKNALTESDNNMLQAILGDVARAQKRISGKYDLTIFYQTTSDRE